MKHIQKFNEAKNRNKQIDPTEKIDSTFDDFIEKLAEVGKIARSEQSHSNFVSSEKDSVDDAISEYGKFLSEVNKKFEEFKSAAKLHYGE